MFLASVEAHAQPQPPPPQPANPGAADPTASDKQPPGTAVGTGGTAGSTSNTGQASGAAGDPNAAQAPRDAGDANANAATSAATKPAPKPAKRGLFSDAKLSVTETAIVGYRFDNRDSLRQNDFYGEWLNRLNVQLTTWRLTAGVRLDSALYVLKPDPNQLATDDANEQRSKGQPVTTQFVNGKRDGYGRDLSSRYVNTVYPSKLFVTYAQPGLDITLGDFYAQLGRGLVLSVRKVDELGVDTTIRGAKVDYKANFADWRLGATALAGYTNPLRVDEATGRQLSQSTTGAREVLFPLAPPPNNTAYVPNAQATFSPDAIYGGRIEGGHRTVQIGVQGVQLERDSNAAFLDGTDPHPARNARRIRNGSVSINVPNLAGHGTFYAEFAGQQLDENTAQNPNKLQREDLSRLTGGTAVYTNVSLFAGDFTFSLDGKYYNHFYPLIGSVSGQVTDFSLVQYSAPPTTEPIWSDTQFNLFNVCVLGGRARIDYRATTDMLIYGSFGRYRSWSERDPLCGEKTELNPNNIQEILPAEGKSAAIQNDVYDPIVGTELNWEKGRTHVFAWTGVRIDHTAEAFPASNFTTPVTTFYREHYVRYDFVKKVTGPWSVQMVGFFRNRFNPLQKDSQWREGENYLSLIYSPKITAAFGYEYTTLFGDLRSYFNGLFQYRFTTDTLVRAFVGQTRPALRCVSGVCRFFPEYSGAKIEAVIRF